MSPDFVRIRAVTQEAVGPIRHLRGSVVIETGAMRLTADELDYNDDTGEVDARGHVHFDHFQRGEKMEAERVEYNVNTETGKFYEVNGSMAARVQARRGVLTTQNPFYFQGAMAERVRDQYILHRGFVTDCEVPNSWWRLRSTIFNIVPGEKATTRNSLFYLRQFPVFYFPFFYKSLRKESRRSGFLLPNVGSGGRRGTTAGVGYYWAINRSYDLTYRAQYFTNAGLAHHVDFRGDPNAKTTGYLLADGLGMALTPNQFPSGAFLSTRISSDLGHGWLARAEVNYISSFAFRQSFSQSVNEAINTQVHSLGFVTKHWDNYGLNIVAQRNVNYQSATEGDDITIRKLPEVQFLGRPRQFSLGDFPVWISFESGAGLQRRSQDLFQTRQFVPRLDFAPQLETRLSWRDVHLIPSFALRETFYDSSISTTGRFDGQNLLRSSRDFSVDLLLPSLSKVFAAPSFLGSKLKHVMEPRVTYKNVSGITDFNRIIRFDETDLLSNTNQVEFSFTNRILAKDKNGTVTDLLNWQVRYQRYFDPTFGGAIVPNTRNLVQSVLDLTGYGYLDGVRRSSPIVSVLRFQSRVGVEWRADYDPLRGALVNTSLNVDGRSGEFFYSMGHTYMNTELVLSPQANQIRGAFGYGHENKRGFNFGIQVPFYDLRKDQLQSLQAQVTYNTDCCGFSYQQRYSPIFPGANGWRIAISIANIGTFGNLKQQERIF